jgi:hypothetical protein
LAFTNYGSLAATRTYLNGGNSGPYIVNDSPAEVNAEYAAAYNRGSVGTSTNGVYTAATNNPYSAPVANPTNNNPPNNPPAPSGPSEYDLINDQYKAAIKSLNTQQSSLMANQQNYYDIATTPYSSQVPLINSAAQQGQNAILGQQNTAQVQEQNALAAARNLYDQLTSRNRSAFGSGALGSVGQASSEILGRSAQEQFGNIRNTAGQTMQQLQTAATDLTTKTNDQLNSLDQQKQAALAQAKISFQDKLDYISQQKDQAANVKAQNKLSAMQDYRDYVRGLANQADQLRNNIIATAQSNGQDINTALTQFYNAQNSAVGQGQTNVYNQGQSNQGYVGGLQTSNILTGSPQQGDITTQLYGGYNPTVSTSTKKSQDYLSNYYSNLS